MGAIAGWFASLITGAKSRGCGSNIIIGMCGSIVGGALLSVLVRGQLTFTTAFTTFDPRDLIVSVLGAIVLLGIVEIFRD
jgi:uncharacterized membrane protein YeaQ/YmgE (transglycosylase-associated protein family)